MKEVDSTHLIPQSFKLIITLRVLDSPDFFIHLNEQIVLVTQQQANLLDQSGHPLLEALLTLLSLFSATCTFAMWSVGSARYI